VLADLSRAREGFVLASDLHLVYLVTPINVDVEPDWESYYERFVKLSPLDQVKINFPVLVFQSTMLLNLLRVYRMFTFTYFFCRKMYASVSFLL